jgi:hypothetical protein
MLFRLASASALVAAASMAAAPLAAAEFPRVTASAVAGVLGTNGVNADNHRWHRRDRVDAGDVVAGVLVIGAIAAIASAANSNRDRENRYPQRYPAPDARYDYRDGPRDWRYDSDRGLDRAVDMCAREVERNGRIDRVDGVDRNGDGWRVTGKLATGAQFTCSIGDDGRVDAVDYGERSASNDAQWDDDRYAAARAAQDGTVAPAYPGGPLSSDNDDPADADPSPDFPG